MDTNTHSEAELEALSIIETDDDLLSDLDMTPALEAESDAEIMRALDSSDEAAIEIAGEIADAYTETATSTGGVEAVEAAPVAAEKEKKVRKARTTASPTAVRAPKDLASIDAAVFELGTGADKDAVIALRPTQKKIGEKFDNLFQAIAAGKKPSVYVMACFDVLDTKGEATSSELVAALKASSSRKGSGYDDGTARSQVGQVMVLFNTVGVAERDGQKLTLNRESPVAMKLKALAVAA